MTPPVYSMIMSSAEENPTPQVRYYDNKTKLLLASVAVTLAALIAVVIVATSKSAFQVDWPSSSIAVIAPSPSPSLRLFSNTSTSTSAPSVSPSQQASASGSLAPVSVPTAQPQLTAQPSAPLTSAKTSDVSCDRYYECLGDRLGNTNPIYPGQAICSKGGSDHRFMIGLTPDEGIFHWRDCATNETLVYYNGTGLDLYFVLNDDASWNVMRTNANIDTIQWREESLHQSIQNYPHCLNNPLLDCPYLHLRKSGVIVLNFIDPISGWIAENIRHAYPNLDTPTQ